MRIILLLAMCSIFSACTMDEINACGNACHQTGQAMQSYSDHKCTCATTQGAK